MKHINDVAEWLVQLGFPFEFYSVPAPSYLVIPLARAWQESHPDRSLDQIIRDVLYSAQWSDYEFRDEDRYEFPVVIIRGTSITAVVKRERDDFYEVSFKFGPARESVVLAVHKSEVVEIDRVLLKR